MHLLKNLAAVLIFSCLDYEIIRSWGETMNTAANAAFYYIAEGYDTSGKSLMGRHAAGEGFLKGFAKHSGVSSLYCYGPDQEHFHHFRQSITQATGKENNCIFIPFADFPRLSEVGCLFFPGPDLSNNAWVRRTVSSRAYSICGVTHTTATERIMDSFGELLTGPFQSWDAVVCTSTVVKKTLQRVVDGYAGYLEDRIGVRPRMLVQLPVIPLGVDCERFSAPEGEDYRAAWRKKLGIANEDIAILYVGRLNFNAKAHPLPMFLALEEVVRRTGKKVCLILAGWFDPPASEALWRQDVQKYCSAVKAVFLDGRQEDVRREIWSAADIFTSLSDNIQETFGLTPIEAMAAGLPVVVTDWDGYRDTIRHGIDGFRVPVLMPEPGMGEDLAVRFANRVDVYGKYCGTVSQMTGVDINACFIAYMQLVQNKELRLRMGSAGRQRARDEYDWGKVVRNYQELWRELGERRIRDAENAPARTGKVAMPLRQDPFTLFQEYPTGQITGESLITLQAGRIQGWVEHVSSSQMNNYIMADGSILLSRDEQAAIIKHLTVHESVTVADIAKLFSEDRNIVVRRTIGWMNKTGIVRVSGCEM